MRGPLEPKPVDPLTPTEVKVKVPLCIVQRLHALKLLGQGTVNDNTVLALGEYLGLQEQADEYVQRQVRRRKHGVKVAMAKRMGEPLPPSEGAGAGEPPVGGRGGGGAGEAAPPPESPCPACGVRGYAGTLCRNCGRGAVPA